MVLTTITFSMWPPNKMYTLSCSTCSVPSFDPGYTRYSCQSQSPLWARPSAIPPNHIFLPYFSCYCSQQFGNSFVSPLKLIDISHIYLYIDTEKWGDSWRIKDATNHPSYDTNTGFHSSQMLSYSPVSSASPLTIPREKKTLPIQPDVIFWATCLGVCGKGVNGTIL